MILVRNKILPPKGYKAIAIWPFIFYRGESLTETTINHEKIHFAQQKELFIIFFYLLYVIFYLIYGYRNMPFEKEAYENDNNFEYLKNRKFFNWIKYF